MRAAYATAFDPAAPLAGLAVGDRPEPERLGEDWVTVEVRASSLNHHDLWSLRGVGLRPEQLPMILGCDAAGVDQDGNEVVVYPVVATPEDPRGYSLLSERLPGTLAERVAVPRANLVPKPAAVSFVEAACLPTAWLTAYHMLTARGRLAAGDAVLVQGAGGGVATAAVALGVALGARVYATSRDERKQRLVSAVGAHGLPPGARLPERVDVVIETVGPATFDHSLKCAAPGARIVVSGATTGAEATVNLRRVFALRLEILGSSMGTVEDLAKLLDLVAAKTVTVVIDKVYGFTEIERAFAALDAGQSFGKIAIDHTA